MICLEHKNKALSFDDVLLVPQYSNVRSRKDVILATGCSEYVFPCPIISANMPAVTNPSMAKGMWVNGCLGILHKFNSPLVAVDEWQNSPPQTGVSIGVKEESKRRFEELYQAGARIFCLDVAHGHQITVKEMLRWITRELFLWDRAGRRGVILIAGNIATAEACHDLAEWGADIVKVGIGPGSACTTRLDTGVGIPQLQAIIDVANESYRQELPVQIIADGGCRSVGDIAKSIAAGADYVMLGRMLAGADESAAQAIMVNEVAKKIYYGSASYMNKGEKKHIEGIDFLIDATGPLKNTISKITDGLRSSFSYSNSFNIEQFQKNAEFRVISDGGARESKL